ncbi:hypothetical protein [Pseudonocardia oroxyli]|uniref:hypothetical protein n=1 Tax=Pseudonocardia oroxyli TaxID=366584 RepID=UPI00248208FD|nr:hypothetical protein [Pseudonocardia oroxyli]
MRPLAEKVVGYLEAEGVEVPEWRALEVEDNRAVGCVPGRIIEEDCRLQACNVQLVRSAAVAPESEPGRCGVFRDGGDDRDVPVGDPAVDEFDRRLHVGGRRQHVLRVACLARQGASSTYASSTSTRGLQRLPTSTVPLPEWSMVFRGCP